MTDTDDKDEQNSRERVNLVISGAQKEQWVNHVQESEHPSMSQLIRTSVEKEIAGSNNQQSGSDEEMKEAVYDLVDGMRGIQNRLDDMDNRIQGVEQVLSEPPEEMQELMSRVFEALPTEPELLKEQQSAFGEDTPIVVDGTVQTGEIGDIANHLEEQSYQIRRAIEQLQEDSSLVKSQSIAGEERYYRRG